MCPRERDPQENGLWHPVGSGTPVPGTGTAAGKVISACLLSRQTILCLCEAAPAISCPPAPRGFQLTCWALPGAAFSMEVVSASPCCRKPKRLKSHVQGPRGAWGKAGWFHGQKERLRACRRQDKSRERPAGWQVDPTNRAPTPKHSLSAPSFAGER